MNKKYSIQLKAAFLLIVFSLNMVVGFACAVGIDMGFNSEHHHDETAVKSHNHTNEQGHKHSHGQSHHHDNAKHHKVAKHEHKDGKDDCCNDRVVKIATADKAVPQAAKIINPIFFAAFSVVFYAIDITYSSQDYISDKYFVRGNHPPISDIRIAIQSFQI